MPRYSGTRAMILATVLLATSASGRQLKTHFNLVHFRLPFRARVNTITDADYREYRIPYGTGPRHSWLRIMTGHLSAAPKPPEMDNPAIQWQTRDRACLPPTPAKDHTGSNASGHRWRHIAFPFGFAAYSDVPPPAAAYFDKILNTLSCREPRLP